MFNSILAVFQPFNDRILKGTIIDLEKILYNVILKKKIQEGRSFKFHFLHYPTL